MNVLLSIIYTLYFPTLIHTYPRNLEFFTLQNHPITLEDAQLLSSLIIKFRADKEYTLQLINNTLNLTNVKANICLYSAKLLNESSYGIFDLCNLTGKIYTKDRFIQIEDSVMITEQINEMESLQEVGNKKTNDKYMKIFVINDYDRVKEYRNDINRNTMEIYEVAKEIIEREDWGRYKVKLVLNGILNIMNGSFENVKDDEIVQNQIEKHEVETKEMVKDKSLQNDRLKNEALSDDTLNHYKLQNDSLKNKIVTNDSLKGDRLRNDRLENDSSNHDGLKDKGALYQCEKNLRLGDSSDMGEISKDDCDRDPDDKRIKKNIEDGYTKHAKNEIPRGDSLKTLKTINGVKETNHEIKKNCDSNEVKEKAITDIDSSSKKHKTKDDTSKVIDKKNHEMTETKGQNELNMPNKNNNMDSGIHADKEKSTNDSKMPDVSLNKPDAINGNTTENGSAMNKAYDVNLRKTIDDLKNNMKGLSYKLTSELTNNENSDLQSTDRENDAKIAKSSSQQTLPSENKPHYQISRPCIKLKYKDENVFDKAQINVLDPETEQKLRELAADRTETANYKLKKHLSLGFAKVTNTLHADEDQGMESTDSLKRFADVFEKIKSNWKNKDSSLARSNLIIMYSTKKDTKNIEGMTFIGGACSSNDAFSIIKLKPSDSTFYHGKVTAHEILHSLNARHDKDQVNGFLMEQQGCTTCMEDDRKISRYTIDQVTKFIDKQDAKCFAPDNLCGNGVIDPGEECDSGLPFGSDCCTPDCRLRKDCECDDRNGACCIDCKLIKSETCGKADQKSLDNSCLAQTYCDGKSPVCQQKYKQDGEKCVNGFCKNRICQSREVFCERIDRKFDRTCNEANQCKLVCVDDQFRCSVMGTIENDQKLPLLLPDGMPCSVGNVSGQCFKGQCRVEYEARKYLLPGAFVGIILLSVTLILMFLL